MATKKTYYVPLVSIDRIQSKYVFMSIADSEHDGGIGGNHAPAKKPDPTMF